MALQKTVVQENDIETNYHRILYIQEMINQHISIAVISYINKDSRQKEGGEQQPYRVAVTYEKPYQENMTVEEAYEYLKTLPEFEGATDV